VSARALTLGLALAACGEVRELPRTRVTWAADLRPVLVARCGRCHLGEAAAGHWRADRFPDALGCDVVGGDGRVQATRLLSALERPDHAPHVDEAVRRGVNAWLADGARARPGLAHDPGIIDPRSTAFHGRTLRAVRWAPMLDPARPDACGRCHEGAPARPDGVLRTAEASGATPCTDCHPGPQGPLGCETCHGGERSGFGGSCLPWRAQRPGSHAAHSTVGAVLSETLRCTTCHPPRGTELAHGTHGDGVVDVHFDPRVAGEGARFEASAGTCLVRCHGSAAAPRWGGGPLTGACNGCHRSPPEAHPAGTCDRCHSEVPPAGGALLSRRLHLNGRVDLGDGSGGCSACHGRGVDPLPTDRVHQAHGRSALTEPVGCSECHAVPATVRAVGHLEDRGPADVRFGPRASARGAQPTWDGRGCAAVACHGEGLRGQAGTRVAWDAAPIGCDGCHAAPPTFPHTTASSCELATCHGGAFERVEGVLRARSETRRTHIDGLVQAGPP
jgi:predicted CxxxxCH...CXXCH cytochrome family protein